MLLILHNLPKEVTSFDIRKLIQEQCGFRDVILDNLLDEGPGKRITVGLVEEEDAAMLMRKMNGLRYRNCQLYVEDVRKKKPSALSYQVLIPAGLQPKTPNLWFQNPCQKPAETLQVNKNNMPYYMTQESNNTNYGKPTQTTQQNSSIFNQNYQYTSNAVFQAYKPDSLLTYPFTASHPNEIQTPDNPSYISYQNDRYKQGDIRDDRTQSNWRDKSPPSKRHENFGNLSKRKSRYDDKNTEWNKTSQGSRRSRERERSPLHRSSYRENKKVDRRDNFDSSRRSRSSRSNPRDSDRDQISVFGRQRERQEQHGRRSDQKRNYEQVDRDARDNIQKPERFSNNFGTSTTFSSNPENSSFTKPNRSIFDKIIGSRKFGETSKKIEYSSPKQDTPNSAEKLSSKRARLDPPQYFDNRKSINPYATSNKKTELQKMILRHTNWRIQSATLLAKEVLKNASKGEVDNKIYKLLLKKLRECITLRLDVIMGDKMATNLDEILRGYRAKFNYNDDINFFNAVMGKVEREIKETDEVTGPNVDKVEQHYQESEILNKGSVLENQYHPPNPTVSNEKSHQASGKLNKVPNVINPYNSPRSVLTMKPNLVATEIKQKGLIAQNPPKIPFIKNSTTLPRLPKYPNHDKQGFKQFQKTSLLEHEEGFYTLEPELDMALEDEVEKLVKCYREACEPSSNKDEENIRNKIITSTAAEFKNFMKLRLTKRILNVTDGLTLRITSSPIPPPIAALNAFLQRHGAINLKKSDTSKMFVANCGSHESYDRLLALQSTKFGSITVNFKPYQVLGQVTNKNKKSNQVIDANAVEDFTKDVDESDIDLANDFNDDPDVMLVANDQCDVVVLSDDADKSINSEIENDNIDVHNDGDKDKNDLEALHSNDKVAASNENTDKPNEVNDNDTQVNDSDEKVQGSIEKVPDLQSEESINISDKNVPDYLEENLNVDEILEEDLEDF